MLKVFISRELGPDAYLRKVAIKNGWKLTATSLIHQTPTSTQLKLPEADLVFFSSPTAVNQFVHRFGAPMMPVSTIGTGTSSALPDGVLPIFEGTGTTEEVATKFAGFAKGKQVLFPIGNLSVRTVQNALPPSACIELVLYTTSFKQELIPAQDIYVFTSPSNVHSFLESNDLPSHASVIALGKKTAEALQNVSISSVIAANYSPQGICDTIFSIVGS